MPAPASPPHPPRFTAPHGLLWEIFDDVCLVFDPRCDKIHRLNPTAAAVLAELEAEPLTADDIGTRLSAMAGGASGPDVREQVAALLNQFDELGLIGPPLPAVERDR